MVTPTLLLPPPSPWINPWEPGLIQEEERQRVENEQQRREELEEVIVLININNMRVDYFLLPLEITVVHVHKTTNVDR